MTFYYRKLREKIQGKKHLKEQSQNQFQLEMGIHRSIQILTEMYNDIMWTIVLMAFLSCGLSQIVCLFALINSNSQSTSTGTMFLNLFFVSVVVQSVCIILGVYGVAGNFHQDSANSLASLKKIVRDSLAESKYIRKIWKCF